MTLPTNWNDGDTFHGSDINAIDTQVNTDTAAIAGLVPWSGGTAGILPATSGQHLTTQGGNLLDDGAGNVVIKGTVQGASKLVSIGDSGYGASVLANATSTAGTSEMMFKVGVAATSVSALWSHWYTQVATQPFTDTDPSGSITFSASLRVVSSSNPGTVVNQLYRLTFNGRTTATLDPGGKIAADALGLSLAAGDVVAVRTYLSSGTAYAPRRTWGDVNSGWGGFTSASDLTAPGSAAIASSGGYYYGPSTLLGQAEGAGNAKSVRLLGDSIGFGVGDSAVYTIPAASQGGYVFRALTGLGGLLNVSVSGDLAAWYQSSNGSFRRLGTAPLCNSAIIEYGTNDLVTLGSTAATIEAINLNLSTNLRRMGITKVFLITLVPRTTSTDGWATTANQTPLASESQRVAYNTWVRANCPIDPTTKAPVAVGTSGALLAGNYGHPITGYFDTASTVESSLNSGRWLPATRVATGSITSGSNTLTSSTANFLTANQESGGDKGSTVVLIGAGTSGANLTSTAVTITSSTQVSLTNLAGTTVTNAQLNIGTTTMDGVHPSGKGHYLMASAINTALL